ncbi:MAG: hypothetical protein ACYDGR_13900 [Candidatus Dormibacteria bacterium]
MAAFDVEVRVGVEALDGGGAYDLVALALGGAGMSDSSIREVVDENFDEVELHDTQDRPPAQAGGGSVRDGLAQIAAVMSGREWSSDTLDEVAAIVRTHGHEVKEVAEEDAGV